MNGTIKRLVTDKGFGFIAAGDGTASSLALDHASP